jgi:hypothetical protein
MLTLNAQYSQGWRLLPGQQEVTGPGGNTTSGNFCPQVEELEALGYASAACGGSPPATWYMLEAVRQHEFVHSRTAQTQLEGIAPTVESRIESLSLCVDHTPGKTRNMAIDEIRVSAGFAAEVSNAQSDWFRALPPAWATDHAGETDIREYEVVDGMVTNICNVSRAQCWAYCPACPARETGSCCNPGSGTCSIITRCDCIAANSNYQGNGATCGPPNPCVGACCPNGVGIGPNYPCTLTTASGCSGQFVGLGTSCTANPCWPPG